TIGIRWSSYSFLTNLITKFSRPVTATSANASGKKTPYALADIFAHLSGKQQALIDLVLDAGTLPKNPPSLVIDTTTSTPIIMRPNHQTKISLPENAPTYRTHSDEETRALAGKILLSHFKNLTTHPLTITLDGELGAGKTTFTQGLAQFLGITDIVNSPTYTYQKEYPYQKFDHQGTLYHLDVWTLDRPEMLQALELEKLAQPNNLIVIEWYHTIASFFTPSLPWLEIALQPDTKKPNDRLITLTPHLENSPSASTASFQVTASTQKVPKKYPSSTQKVTASNSKNKKVSKI
ncbi:tRNA (adenosine(37)-N6)-threonylcarbamoyltransferase complex ATPase subunit type 1 TsaE, partial [bacterium]|nr:tRNA (adenosine(37)-N6)-threonylcarbamoyltransferase complex ATPase subunit type 1 TsaE [bacterium]